MRREWIGWFLWCALLGSACGGPKPDSRNAQEAAATQAPAGAGAQDDQAARAQALLAAANEESDLQKAYDQAEEAFRLFVKEGDTQGMTDARQITGVVLFQAGEYETALEHFSSALDILKSQAGASTPTVDQGKQRIVLLNLAGLSAKKLHQFDLALTHYKEALDGAKRLFGEEDLQTGTILDNIGSLYGELGDPATAVQYASMALIIFKTKVGVSHRDTLTCQNNLAQHFEAAGMLEDAITNYRQVIDLEEETLGKDHPMRGIALDNLGVALRKAGQHDDALKCQLEALEILTRNLGEKHPEVAIVLGNLGTTHEEMKQPKKALSYFQQSREMLLEFFEETHPLVQGMDEAIRRVGE